MDQEFNDLRTRLQEFAAWCSSRYSGTTVKTYHNLVGGFVGQLNNKGIQEVSIVDVTAYYAKLREQEYSSSTIAYTMIALRQFFKFLFLRRLIAWDYQLIGVPRYLSRSHVAIQPAEAEAMIDLIDVKDFATLRDKLILAFLYSSGVRVSELCDLVVSDLHPEEPYAVIVSKKNYQRRMVFWDNRTTELLKDYLVQRADRTSSPQLFIGTRRPNVGSKLSTRQIERLVVKYRTAGHITPHSFRHGLGMRSVKAGIHPRYIQQILGHKNLNSSQIYMQVQDEDVRAAYAKLAK